MIYLCFYRHIPKPQSGDA